MIVDEEFAIFVQKPDTGVALLVLGFLILLSSVLVRSFSSLFSLALLFDAVRNII